MNQLEAIRHPDVLVGVGDSDDAGVYRVADGLAIVQTVDFFTPIVDDPATWGRITAANALSDIYAMGAKPITALQLVGWPRDTLPFELLGDVIGAGVEVMAGAGCVVIGGHSVDDPEPKYGFAVTGVVDPNHILTNVGGRPGDALILTKPVGTGIVATAHKRGLATTTQLETAVAAMEFLNDRAAEVALARGASGVTDVTGFGLLGHLSEMLDGVAAVVIAGAVPVLPGARDFAADGVVPGGTKRNLGYVEGFTDFGNATDVERVLLADAQTSGGLLMAVPRDAVDDVVSDLEAADVMAAVVGRIVDAEPGTVRVE